MPEVTLKNCPMCNSGAKVLEHGCRNDYVVVCEGDECTIRTGWYGDIDNAVAAWNRRAPEPEEVERLRKLDEYIEKYKSMVCALTLNPVFKIAPEPGTSVVRWMRYTGEPETLPEDCKYIIAILQEWPDGWAGETDIPFHKPNFRIGDLWAYLPEPPEGMG